MSGLELSRRFYTNVLASLLDGVPHSAGLLGNGSEVLGFDDEVSRDHAFGPRAQILVAGDDEVAAVHGALERLPETFEGLPVHFVFADRFGSAAHHQVEVATVSRFFADRIGCDPVAGVRLSDWLTIPTQALATLVGGAVFHDPDGSLTSRREALRWYPDDVWRYALAAGWLRVSQEEAFVGRTGAAGDDLGSALVTARIARELVRIAFLIERRWAPYSKWLGTAFSRLPIAATVAPHLNAAVHADGWREREAALCAAQRELAIATNRLGLAAEVDPEPRQFYGRDIRVLFGGRFTSALADAVTDPEVRALIDGLGLRIREDAAIPMLPGTIDQAVDSTDVLSHVNRCKQAEALLRG
jgi:catechol 2,3-dioxygenase-like lactoylglutathione lyase family enzyme